MEKNEENMQKGCIGIKLMTHGKRTSASTTQPELLVIIYSRPIIYIYYNNAKTMKITN